MARMLLIAVALIAASLTGRAVAQTPPDAAELAAYRGLHAAAASGDVAAIRKLAGAGEGLDQRDGNGRAPLHVAAFRGQVEAIRALIGAGADPGLFDNQRYDAVTIVSVTDDVPALRALLASGASAKLTTSRYDGTALIAAAHLGHDGIVRELIKAGAPLDHVNNLGWTALIEAVILGDGGKRHVETVRALVAAGANRDLADNQRVTPLRHARARGYAAIVALLEAGAPR
ncbi:ankyrin repeat domain-containing protein [Bosea sp. UC22_33]|uniref:ankyrin repeat domain-containing protein n=1 Tax=Bosea sp. UC22_33 TaxID=3350165 RepID=UPI00366B8536